MSRRFKWLFAACLAAVWFAGPALAAGLYGRDCTGETVCPLAGRGYHVLPPENWNGVSKLPVLLHFHGWKRQGSLVVKHSRIAGATAPSGVLLVAPNGLHESWDFWDADTADVAFADAVLEDVKRHWPVDESRIYVSGYSYGSAMAWRFACEKGEEVTALLAISGTLPNQMEICPTPPVAVRHVHGLKDTVMDFPFGPGGDVTWPVALWRRKDGCAAAPDSVADWAVTKHDTFTRYTWSDCTSGKPVILDLHQRGHFIPVGWIQQQLDELL